MGYSYDQAATKILFDAYWSTSGWKPEKERNLSPDAFIYAKHKGLMFDSASVQHDDVIKKVASLVSSVPVERVSEAFLYSLTTRDLPYRSALGSYAMCRWMPVHSYPSSLAGHACTICNDYGSSVNNDYNVLNFERLKWGGVRHQSPIYQLFDLTEFLKLPTVSAKEEDRHILKEIIKEVRLAPASAKPSDLVKNIAKHISSNKSEREKLIEILAYCGILKPKKWSGFFKEFTKNCDREMPPVNKTDWSYPIWWWRGSDGVNDEALKYYFPSLSES